nr:putative ribonuclease h protein [Quercus suber]
MECEFLATEKTREEAAELQRSTKKVKEDHPTGSTIASEEGLVREPLSYKAKLVGELPGAYAQAFEVHADSDIDAYSDDEKEDLSEGEVAIKLSREMKQHIRGRWAHSLIVKVHGRTVGFHFLHSRIMQLWKPAGRLDCIDLGEDFFLIKFGLVEDYDLVLKGGLWFVGEHYLTIRAWEPYFKPNATACSKVAVWARLPRLPIEFYDLGVLKEIGNVIGPVLRIDAITASGTRGRYARICVQVDLAKPLVRKVFIGRFGQEVLYEGISSLCFACGRLGHRREACPYLIKEAMVTQTELRETEGTKLDDVEKPKVTPSEEVSNVKEEYGPWMLVERRKQGPRQGHYRPNSSKTSDTKAGAFNAKDLGHQLRSQPTIVPPFSPPSYSPEGKRKSVGLDSSNAASQYSPQKKEHDDPLTPSPSGTGLSQSNFKQNHPNHKGKNGSKGKGKGKQQQQVQGEQKSATLGNKNQREDLEFKHVYAGADPIKPHHDLGLVRTESNGGMESYIPVNSQEQKNGVSAHDKPGLAGVGKPLVEISNGHTIKGGSKNPGVESAVSKFAGANLAKIKPAGGNTNKENVRISGVSNKFDGVFGSHQANSTVWGKYPNQTPNVQGRTDGDIGACDMLVEDRGNGQGQYEESELEVAESSKEPIPSFAAECWALRDGLRLCLSLGITAVEVEVDASSVVSVLANAAGTNSEIDPLVDECRDMLKRIPQARLKHCYRESNKCADRLARLGTEMEEEFFVFDTPPPVIVPLLFLDKMGTTQDRICNEVGTST